VAKGRTLWEMLKAKLQGPVELRYYNPLKAKIGASVMVNDLDLKDFNFFVKEIRQYERRIGPNQFFFADYVLLAKPLEGNDVWVRIRLTPIENPDRASDLTHDVLLLLLTDDLAYNEGLHKVVKDTTRHFQVIEDGKVKEEYTRINDVSSSYRAEVSVIRDVNDDHRVDPDEVEKIELEYWDYWRETQDAAGQPQKQFLFVEMNTRTGWMQIWSGREMDPHQIMVL
jgi:hypothetical protein